MPSSSSSKAERLEVQYEQLMLLRLHNLSYAQIAAEMRVSERTLKRWAADTVFKEQFAALQERWHETARAKVAMWGDQVITAMLQIGLTGHSEMARVQALKTMGEWMGLGLPREKPETESKAELEALYAMLSERAQPRPVLNVTQWQPAGIGRVTDAPVVPLDALHPDVVEAEVRQLPPPEGP